MYKFNINLIFKLNYEVSIITGTEKGAATSMLLLLGLKSLHSVSSNIDLFLDAHGHITLYGENGESGKRPLKKGFERGETDKFLIECLDLGQLKKVTLEHDNTSFKKVKFKTNHIILATIYNVYLNFLALVR